MCSVLLFLLYEIKCHLLVDWCNLHSTRHLSILPRICPSCVEVHVFGHCKFPRHAVSIRFSSSILVSGVGFVESMDSVMFDRGQNDFAVLYLTQNMTVRDSVYRKELTVTETD